jgi:hypothetical protein
MIKILADAVLGDIDPSAFAEGAVAGLMDGYIWKLFFYLLVIFGVYVYISLAYSSIGKKAKLTNPGVAWMPGGGPLATIFESAQAHWWPFPALLLGVIISCPLLLAGVIRFVFAGLNAFLILGVVLFFGSLLLFNIMVTIWHWKTYKVIGKPGWFVLVPIIGSVLGILLVWIVPSIGLIGSIIMLLSIISHFVFIGIAAWSKQ